MNWWLFAFQIAAVVLAPILIAGEMAYQTQSSRIHWLTKAAFAVAIMALLWVMPIWHVVGTWVPWVQASILATGLLYAAEGFSELPWWKSGEIWPQAFATVGYPLLTAVVLVWAWGIYAAGTMPQGQDPIELTFPLHDGQFYVVAGGSTQGGNRHRMILETKKADQYRGQAQALDLVQLNDWGIRARGIHPLDRTKYAIFGTPVYAPCSGEAVRVRDGLTDYDPPGRDRENLAGNHVVLECDGAHVALAHLKKGSVTVQRGNAVKVGQKLGEIGNSGNTTEPHLHIHAQTPSENEHFMGGDPLPMTFGGEYLGPGEVVRVQTN
jgi:hypothetical protein